MSNPSSRGGAVGRALLADILAALVAVPARAHHPHDPVDVIELSPAFARDATVFMASPGSINLFMMSRNGGYTFEESRSGLRALHVTGVAYQSDWETSGTAYVSTTLGVQKTTNFGRTWQDPVVGGSMRFIALPSLGADGKQIVFAATRNRLYRSVDSGVKYRPVKQPVQHIRALALSPDYHNDKTLVLGTKGAVQISRDDGNTWQKTTLEGEVKSVEFSPDFARDRTLWVGTWGSGLLVSTDGGATLAPCGTGIADTRVSEIEAVANYPNPPFLALVTRDDGLHTSTDGGQTWTLNDLRVRKTFQSDDHYRTVELSPHFAADGTMFVGSYGGMYISRDWGKTWSKSNINPTRMMRYLAISPTFAQDRKVYGTGYGMQLIASEDGGDTWDIRVRDFMALSGYGLVVSPFVSQDGIVIVGTNMGLRRSENEGHKWNIIDLPPHTEFYKKVNYEIRTIHFSPDFQNDHKVFCISKGGFYRSEDDGKTWVSGEPPCTWAAQLDLSPDFANDQTLFVGGTSLHRSTDGGKTFSEPVFPEQTWGVAVAPDFKDSGEMFLISLTKGFAYSTDRGLTWTINNEGLEGYHLTWVRVSPGFAQDNTLFVTTTGGGLFRSRDRGRSFQRVSELGTPIDHGVSFVLSPDFPNDQTMFIGNYNGVWRSTDAGQTWEPKMDIELYDDNRLPWTRWGEEWKTPKLEGSQGRGVSRALKADHIMRLPFTGSGVRLYGTLGPDHGKLEVHLDGQNVKSVDAYAAEFDVAAVLYEDMNLPYGFHELVVRVLGEKNPASKGTVVQVDAAHVRYAGATGDEVPVFAMAAQGEPPVALVSGASAPAGGDAPRAGGPRGPARGPASEDGGDSNLLWWIVGPIGVLILLRLLLGGRKGQPQATS